MTDAPDHGLLRREIVVFMAALPPGDPKPRFCARFSDGNGYLPICLYGRTKDEAHARAEAWRQEEVAKEMRRREADASRVKAAKARKLA